MENGKPALVMFRAGATDGRMTQVLPFERPPNAEGNRPAGGNGNVPPGVDPEEMRKAFERKLEPGTKVITDSSGASAP
jgi:hypothetical protein